MMQKQSHNLLILFLSLLCAANSQAAVLTYDESINGDIGYPAPIFNLGTGINTISGSIFIYDEDGFFDFDVDSFGIYVPENSLLSTISVEYSVRDDADSNDAGSIGIGFGLSDCGEDANCSFSYLSMIANTDYRYTDPNDYSTGSIDLSGISIGGVSPPIVPLIEELTDLQGGNYYAFDGISYEWGYGDSFAISDNFDYQITFNVTPVPVPPAMWLFGSGLFALVGIARSKSTLKGSEPFSH